MTTPFIAATAAYGSAQRLISQGTGPSAPATAAGGAGGDFAQMLGQAVQGTLESGARSDQMAMDLVSGKANVVDMVTAISETEIAIETMVTVRDRVISAYEEIMRMPI